MKHPIGQIMDKDVYTCNQSQTLGEVIQILVSKEVGGLTVIDDDRHVVGFISDGDIMRSVAKQRTCSIYGGADSVMVLYDNETFEQKVSEFRDRNVMELATRKVYCVSPGHTIEEVAKLLSKKKFKKIPIVEKDGTIVGIARRSTIMRYIFQLLFGLEEVKEEPETSWYFMVDTYIDEENGRGEYEDYIRQVKPIVESYGGEYLVRTENLHSLSEARTPRRAIVIRFDSRERLDACFASPEYRAIMDKRENSVDSRAIIAEGLR